MIFLLLVFVVRSAPSFDYGNADKTILTRVFLPSSEPPIVTIPSRVVEIISLDINSGAFSYCRDKIEEIMFNNLSVISKIGPYCFAYCTNLRIADMSNCVYLKDIPNYCFSGCISLAKVLLPPNLLNVGEASFAECSSIKKIDLPNSTQFYGGYAFRRCLSLTEFYITHNVTSFQISPWFECSNLTKIGYIGKSKLTSFGNWAFSGIPLKILYVPSSLMYIGQSIIGGCYSIENIILESVEHFSYQDGLFMDSLKTKVYFGLPRLSGKVIIPNTVTTLLGSCMSWLTFITEVEMPDSISCLQATNHFGSCMNLTKIVISKALTEIPTYFVYGCSLLEEIVLHEGITKIGIEAFMYCRGLKRIYMPSTLTDIKMGAFKNTNPDLKFIFTKNSTIFVENFHMYTLEYKTVVAFFGDQTTIEIQSKTVHINGKTYGGLDITDVIFAEGSELKSIGDSAFAGCSKLKNVVLPPTVESLGESCFSGCSSLGALDLGRSLLGLNASVLSSSVLVRLVIPSSVRSISERAFEGARISALEFESSERCTSVGLRAFASVKKLAALVLPKSLSEVSREAFAGSELVKVEFSPPSSLEALPISCFSSCASLAMVRLPSGCRSIGDRAFEGCAALAEVNLPGSVEELGVKCFSGCAGLSSFVIGDDSRLSSVLSLAFEGCSALTSFTVSAFSGLEADGGLLYRDARTSVIAFLSASPMRELEIEDGVAAIGRYVFQGAANLERVLIPASVRQIGMQAFQGCTGLRELVLDAPSADGLDIESEAFSGCASLGCDSVRAAADVARLLLEKGILESSLERCPTAAFTANAINRSCGALLCATLQSEGGL